MDSMNVSANFVQKLRKMFLQSTPLIFQTRFSIILDNTKGSIDE